MKIGMSIQSSALRASISNEKKRVHMADFPSLEKYIDFLASLGVSSIEVRIYDQKASYEDFEEAFELIQEKGLNITIHGELTQTEVGNRVHIDYPSLPPLLEKLKLPITMPIHASQGNDTTFDYTKRTVQIVNTWGNELNQPAQLVQFAIENNRMKKVIDPCHTIKGTLKMVRLFNRKDIGICWDMGHYYSNILQNKEEKPTHYVDDSLLNTFCQHVVHTHIHGLHHDGTTHFPITKETDLPLQSFVQLLEQNGYQGIYNLELSHERWPETMNAKQVIEETIRYLQSTIKFCRKGLQ